MWQIISDYLGICIISIAAIVFAKITLNQKLKTNKIQTIIVFLIITTIFLLSSIYMTGTMKTLFLAIVHMIEFKTLFDISHFKAVFLTIIYVILTLLSEIIVLLIIAELVNVSKANSDIIIAGGFIGNLITGIAFLLLTIISRKLLQRILKTEVSDNIKIVILSFITLIPILLFFYSLIKKFSIINDGLQYLSAIIVLLTVLFSLIKQTINNKKIMRDYDKLLEIMTTYESEIEKQRILRHEIKNEFRTIRAKISDNQDNKEIIAYIDEIVNDKYEMNQEKYAQFVYLPPNGIKGLCYFKMQEAEEKGANVAVNISKRVQQTSVYKLDLKQQRDFGRILGVFLDNAIEASLESEKKQIGIEAYANSKQDFKLIITNTYQNKIENNKIGKERFSTKGKTRGHGLLLVKQLVSKNEIIEIKTDIKEELYIQTIIVKNYKSTIN